MSSGSFFISYKCHYKSFNEMEPERTTRKPLFHSAYGIMLIDRQSTGDKNSDQNTYKLIKNCQNRNRKLMKLVASEKISRHSFTSNFVVFFKV